MKIGCVYPTTPMWPKMQWVHRALSSMGHDASQVSDRKQLAAADATCDLLILMHRSPGIRWPNLKDIALNRKATWVQWWFDMICHDNRPLRDQPDVKCEHHRLLMQACDAVFVKELARLGEYRELGIAATYLDQGSPAHWPLLPAEPQWDVLLWGQGGSTYPERTKAANELVKAGYAVAWAGHVLNGTQHLPWFKADAFPELAAKARVLLHVSRRNDLEGYTSDGFWMACATGRPVVKRWYPGIPDGPMLTFRDSHELLAVVKRAMEQDGREVREWALANHTIEHRCRQLLEIVQRAGCAAALAS